MKNPKRPPDFNELWEKLAVNMERLSEVYNTTSGPLAKGKYLHWDKLRNYSPPKGLSLEEWWWTLKMSRRNMYKPIGLCDSKESPFKYLVVDPISENLHVIDQGAGGFIQMPEQITNRDTRDQYYISSLIKESITSSQLEGAVTTRKIAKEMIQSGRDPRDKSEQMILNNFKTMQRISGIKDKPLSKDLVFEIQRLVTEKTLDDVSGSGRFRKENERIFVGDMYNEVFHNPPPAGQLEDRLAMMCDFANDKSSNRFIHPVIRSIILHFWLAYDHPFVDGNGRTARALFYWSMLRHGYWLFEFVSISQVILNAPAKYYRAFLHTETDDNDMTYFILYHLKVVRKAIKELHDYIERKTTQLRTLEKQLQGIVMLNYRQRVLVTHALRHPNYRYTIKSHQTNHNIVYQTARVDLLDLCNSGLLTEQKIGRTLYFYPVPDIEAKLSGLSD